ncbi:hypothetical protein [Aurantiacibacter aquimixticola]|uniref:Uncharacterized protein n=1 Tax=Aurantiacibacter aquimixticola TaxID=1958945 RepID=A0A419RVF8_9SPHN|nr:hypothetical protein [Aurantiacibacter aquimixticola]RJY09776.1 hypothetical protein D6201_10810 [Aurantiacibacter aquimixticola]
MIGKLIGAAAGAAISKETRKLGGAGGAILGALAVPIITRMRLPTLLALGFGGYAVKKLSEKDKSGRIENPAAAI